MTDEVPHRIQLFRTRALPFPLLHAIFSKMLQTRLIGLAYQLCRMRFRNADQGNLLIAASNAMRRTRNPLLYSKQLFPNSSVRHPQSRILARASLRRPMYAVTLRFDHSSHPVTEDDDG